MRDNLNKILLVDKPTDITSFGVIARLKRKFNIKKIGHAGTLDPNATGLLIVMIDKATKLLPYINEKTKTYSFRLRLGIQTTTGDIWGDVKEQGVINAVDHSNINEIANSFIGEYQQLPPMVSAIKHRGKKLYEYARENIEIHRELRNTYIYELDLKIENEQEISGRVVCSKGTYVRTLCEDIGKRIDNLATMIALNRDAIGNISVDEAFTLDQIENDEFDFINIRKVLKDQVFVEYNNTDDIYNGRDIKLNETSDRVFITNSDQILAVYERVVDKRYHCERGLW